MYIGMQCVILLTRWKIWILELCMLLKASFNSILSILFVCKSLRRLYLS